MEITHIAHSCFQIKGKDLTIVIDPYDPKIGHKEPKLSCDVLILSHSHYDHAYTKSVSGYHLLIEGPGEYETQGVYIQGIQTYHDDQKGAERGKNTIYLMEIDGFKVLHLGDLGHTLSNDVLEKVADADVLMVPVGGTYTIDSKVAAQVVSSIEPKVVIPMHYQTDQLDIGAQLEGVKEFLEEMGAEDAQKSPKLKVAKPSDFGEDTEVLVLEPTH